jgi:hypothetical protein
VFVVENDVASSGAGPPFVRPLELSLSLLRKEKRGAVALLLKGATD